VANRFAEVFAGPFVDVPIRLADATHSPLAGRVAFLFNGGDDSDELRDSLAGRQVTAFAGDLFGRGIQALFRNYLAGRGVGNGIAALTDDQGFLRAVRGLTDEIYACDGHSVVDASPGNARVVDVIKAVYPEAKILNSPAEAAAWRPAPPRQHSVAEPRDLSQPPIFVVGVPRSGTTWVENMLLAHPAIAGPRAETSVFVSLRALRANGLPGWMPTDALVAAIRSFVAGLFGRWLDANARRDARFLEKTPLHAEHLALIGEVFPAAAVIGVHRDGRDVVRSLLEMEAATDDVVVTAQAWSDISRAVSAAVPTLPHAREEHYEAMLRDPVAAIREILVWLGLEADAATLAEVARRAGERVSQYNTTGEVGAGKWTSLSARDLRAVYHHAGARLVELGYLDAVPRRRWWQR
jgi:Sulfotransferase family